MKSTRRIGIIVVGILLYAGTVPASPPEGISRVREKGFLEYIGGVELLNTSGLEARVLYLVPEGKPVEKGDLLAELDTATLLEKHAAYENQMVEINAKLSEVNVAMKRNRDEGPAQIKVAELGLAVAEGARKAYVEGEYPLEVNSLEQKCHL